MEKTINNQKEIQKHFSQLRKLLLSEKSKNLNEAIDLQDAGEGKKAIKIAGLHDNFAKAFHLVLDAEILLNDAEIL